MEVPELLGTIVSVFMRYVSKGECVYKAGEGNELWTYTRVKEKIGDYQLVVGGFSAAGLFVFTTTMTATMSARLAPGSPLALDNLAIVEPLFFGFRISVSNKILANINSYA